MTQIKCLKCDHEFSKSEESCTNCNWTYKVQSEEDYKISLDAEPVCLSCLTKYETLDNYCKECGFVVGRYTEYQPFESIRFSYSLHRTIWKKFWHDKNVPLRKKFLSLLILLFIEPLYVLFIPVEVIKKKLTAKKNI